MAVQSISELDIWSEEFAATRDFLERFGIASGPVHEYDKDDVFKAIRARGWDPSVEPEKDPPGFVADITEWRTVTESQSAIAYDQDEMMALLRALRIALTWPTPEEEIRSFDEHARALVGMSANEFMEKYHADELDLENPLVAHLLIARPVGW